MSGEKFSGLRTELLLSQDAFAKKVGMKVGNVQRLSKPGTHGIYLETFGKVAEALEMSPAELRARIGAVEPWDPNVEPYSEVRMPEIPMFDLAVAAGGWTDVTEIGAVCDPRQIDHGLFRVRIRGDSMLPRWKEGMIVEFRCLRADQEGPVVGKDYYVQRDDTATFKRLEKITEEELVLRPLNRRKYPKPMTVARSMVVRMAQAMYEVKPA